MSKVEPDSLRESFDELLDCYGRDEFVSQGVLYLEAVALWKPGCRKSRTYTYKYRKKVDDCPLTDKQEGVHEKEAQKLAEKKVADYCNREKDCKTLVILESEPTGGGCNCIDLSFRAGKVCTYEVDWTVKYKCVKEDA